MSGVLIRKKDLTKIIETLSNSVKPKENCDSIGFSELLGTINRGYALLNSSVIKTVNRLNNSKNKNLKEILLAADGGASAQDIKLSILNRTGYHRKELISYIAPKIQSCCGDHCRSISISNLINSALVSVYDDGTTPNKIAVSPELEERYDAAFKDALQAYNSKVSQYEQGLFPELANSAIFLMSLKYFGESLSEFNFWLTRGFSLKTLKQRWKSLCVDYCSLAEKEMAILENNPLRTPDFSDKEVYKEVYAVIDRFKHDLLPSFSIDVKQEDGK